MITKEFNPSTREVFLKVNGDEIPARKKYLLGFNKGWNDPNNWKLQIWINGKWTNIGKVGDYDQGVGGSGKIYYFEF